MVLAGLRPMPRHVIATRPLLAELSRHVEHGVLTLTALATTTIGTAMQLHATLESAAPAAQTIRCGACSRRHDDVGEGSDDATWSDRQFVPATPVMVSRGDARREGCGRGRRAVAAGVGRGARADEQAGHIPVCDGRTQPCNVHDDPSAEVPVDVLRRLIAMHVEGTLLWCQQFARALDDRPGDHLRRPHLQQETPRCAISEPGCPRYPVGVGRRVEDVAADPHATGRMPRAPNGHHQA